MDAYSALTGEQYLFNKDILGAPVQITDNLPFTKDDAELIFTNILYESGLARVLIKPGVYNITRMNEAKGRDVQLIPCDQNTPPKLPNTYDLVTLQYRFTNGMMAKNSENVIRTYVDMGARIYGIEYPGMIYITEVAKHLNKAYAMLKDLDVKPTKEFLEKQKAWDAARLKEIANGGGKEHNDKRPPAPPKKEEKK